jgi:hypothetical protein
MVFPTLAKLGRLLKNAKIPDPGDYGLYRYAARGCLL